MNSSQNRIHRRWLKSLWVLAALQVAFGATQAFAQYGKVAGRVTDAATGEALPGVNVLIEGTTQGTSTDADGEYVIIGLRPGTYTIVASFIGFQTVRVENVRVQIDLTTRQDIQLREAVLEGAEVVVTAERPLVQKDLTATTAVVSGEEIRAIPVENFSEVVNLQAGVVNGHFRGGRIGEVGYWVDGLPVTDVFDGGLAVSVENDMVEEMQVVTGAFNAEYGQAMSGIVNVVTRDGSNRFGGSFSGFTGDYFSGNTDVFPNLDSVSPAAVRNAELNLSGPLLKDRFFFFTSGRYFHNDGHIYGRNVYGFEDVGLDNTGRLVLLNPSGSGDSSLVALNPYDKLSGQAKLTLRLTGRIRVAANLIASQENFKGNDFALYYFPQAQLDQKRWARSSYLKWTHTLSNRTFYEIGLTNNFSAYREWLFEDPNDARYRDPELFNFSDYLITAGFRAGGTNNRRFSRSTDTYLVKLDATSQVNMVNLVKVGVEARRHRLKYDDGFVVVDPNTDDQFVSTSGRYDYTPVEFSAYVQDKVELGGLIVNAGVRFDYFDSNGRVFRDPRDPNAVFLENRLRDAQAGPDGELDFTPEAYFEEASASWQVSPRLGVAFPITETGVIHFSYGHFFQVPNFELLYQNPYFLLSSGGSGLIGLVGNANLKPEQTISGEIGLKQQLNATSAIEVTAYYRDIRNLTGTATDPIQVTGSSARYGMLVNSDFGFVRGLVFRFDQRLGARFFAGLDYTYQIAKSNASDPAQVYQAAAAKQDLEKQIVPTNWDQRHTANVSLSYQGPADFGFGLVASVGSGEPYTPRQTTLQTGSIVPSTIPLNSEKRPFVYDVDLSAYKNFSLGGLTFQLFTKIDNLLDTANEYGVFDDTGRATYSLQRNVDQATFRGNPEVLERWYTRPSFFAEPRRVVVGATFSF